MIYIILIKFSEGFDTQKTIKISLREYMKMCDLDSINKARIRLNEDLKILYKCSVAYQSPIKSNNYSEMRLCQDFTIKNSVISVTFGDKFYDMLRSKNMKSMLVPVIVLQCDFKRNPNSFFLGRKLSEYERVNFNKKHNRVISIKSLLNSCPNLKNWEKSKQKKRDIVLAFYRDMSFLEEQIGWHYCGAKGRKLTEEETERIADDDFDTFINLYIQYAFEDEYCDLMKTHIKPINQKAIRLNQNRKKR